MATGLDVGERVFVPASLLQNIGDQPSAFVLRTVLEVVNRSVRIELDGQSYLVASSKCQRNIGLLIIEVGDLDTESTLLDPLSKSVTQFCRLLASDDYVRFFKVRSVDELAAIWELHHAAYSHVVLIAHGNGTGLKFAVDGWQAATRLTEVFDIDDVDPIRQPSLPGRSG